VLPALLGALPPSISALLMTSRTFGPRTGNCDGGAGPGGSGPANGKPGTAATTPAAPDLALATAAAEPATARTATAAAEPATAASGAHGSTCGSTGKSPGGNCDGHACNPGNGVR
jgi:hypothetical protein